MTTTSLRPRLTATWFALARGRLRHLVLPALAAVVLGLTAWPVATLRPGIGLDYSWMIGLHLAFHDGLDFGRDVVFTYGPLGFLQTPQAVYPWPLRLSFAWAMAIQITLAGTLLWLMRRGFRSWWIAVPLVAVLLSMLNYELSLIIGFAGAVALIAGRPRTPGEAVLLACALGFLTGIQFLAKFNTGVSLVLILAVVAATASSNRRRVATSLGAAFAVTVGLGWILTGQALIAFPSYLIGTLQIASGYSSAMMVALPGAEWELWAAAAMGVLGAVVAFHAGSELAWRSRAGLIVAWLILWFFSFKSAYVRHSPGHGVVLVEAVLGGLSAFAWSIRRRDVALLVAFPVVTMFFALTSANPAKLLQLKAHTTAFRSQFAILSDGSRTNDEIAASRLAITHGMPVDEATLAEVRGRRTAVDPWDVALNFGYRIPWDPLPVFQGYVAYTAPLDERNAERLADAERGPERILRHSSIAIDGRNPVWDSPAAMRAMLCHFRQIREATAEWQVLARTENRCGAPHEIKRVEAHLGEAVLVPASPAGELLYVVVDGLGLGPAEKLRTLLYRSVTRLATLGPNRAFRVLPGNVGDGLLLRVPATADYSPAPFALDQSPGTITFTRGEGQQPSGKLTLRFMAAPISD